jgi:hypothetical protein
MARSNMRWRAWRLKLIASQSISAVVEIVAVFRPGLWNPVGARDGRGHRGSYVV